MNDPVALLSALAEPTRLAALRILWDGGEHCVCELMRGSARASRAWPPHGGPADRRPRDRPARRAMGALPAFRRTAAGDPGDVDAVMATVSEPRRGPHERRAFRRDGTSGAVDPSVDSGRARRRRALVRGLLASGSGLDLGVSRLPVVPARISRRPSLLRLRHAEGPDAADPRGLRHGHRAQLLLAGTHPRSARRPAGRRRQRRGAGLGIVTPFCSCSAVPLFVGFVSAGVPLGVTFSFLIAAPMVNEVALGLLLGPGRLEGRR